MNDECKRFMEDPEAHRAHAASCSDCRAFLAEVEKLDEQLTGATSIETRSLSSSVTRDLPLAPWEGAQHRSWSVVVIGSIVVVVLAAIAFASGGMSPVRGFVSAVRQTLSAQMSWMALFRVVPELLQNAPLPFHLLLAASFIAVNLLLYVLMRKSPKGYDAPTR